MSDLGLYSGWYAQLRDCADLVDSVLVELISGDTIQESQQTKLAEFLVAIAEGDRTKTNLTILQRWFAKNAGVSADQLRSLGVRLAASDVSVRQDLEAIAVRLDTQRSEVLASLRGR
jgi:hypothetical protein